MTTGENITQSLLKTGIELKEIARRANIPYISLMQMKAKNKYTSDTIDKLCLATGLSQKQMVSGCVELTPDAVDEIKNKFPDFIDKIISRE